MRTPRGATIQFRTIIMFIVIGLAAVTAVPAATAATEGGSTSTKDLDPNGVVRFANTFPTAQWDPAKTVSIGSDYPGDAMVYDRLIYLNVDNTLAPMLATSWKASEDGLTLTLKLRTDVKFWDGTAFNAAAAAANLNRYMTCSCLVGGLLKGVTAATATDDSTVQLTLAAPNPDLVYALAMNAGFMVNPAAFANPSSLATQPAGSGAYKVASQDQTHVAFEKNPNYWDKKNFIANKKEIYVFPDWNTRLNAFQTGQADAVTVKVENLPDAQAAVDAGGAKLYSVPSSDQLALYVNTNIAPLNNPKVRQAINMAIDRNALSQGIFNGACKPSGAPVTEDFAGYQAAYSKGIKYDPTQAKKILAQESESKFSIDVLVPANAQWSVPTQVIQYQLSKVGITMNLITAQSPTSPLAEFRSGKYGMTFFDIAWTLPDAVSAMNETWMQATPTTPTNSPGPPDPALVQLVAAAQPLPVGSAQRTAALEKINTYLWKNPQHILVCVKPTTWLYKSNVAGIDNMPPVRLKDVPAPVYVALKKKGKA